jgi:hypothetical protein
MKIVHLFLLLLLMVPMLVHAYDQAPALPRSSNQWLDGKALSWGDLKGKVVLLNVWTFGCWNSYRSLPWIVSLQNKFPNLQIIGVHSPEFGYEKDRNKLRQTMAGYKVHYPQILDDDHGYWNALGNSYWPCFYIVDKQGRIRFTFSGETHVDDEQARAIEKAIQSLQNE